MSRIKGYPGLFRPEYRGKDGNNRESGRNIWGLWYCRGCPKHPEGGRHRENLKTNLVKQAVVNLARLKSQPKGPVIDPENTTVNWLLERYLNYAFTYCKRSTFKEYEDLVRVHLRPNLGFYRATDLIYDSSILEKFVAKKQQSQVTKTRKGYSTSRINAMLTLLAASYEHAHKELSGMRPKIKKLENRNVRKEFFQDNEVDILFTFLPAEIVRPLRVLNMTGWRSWSEIFSRKQNHADWKKGALILDPYEAKNSEPRIFPFNNDLKSILEEQRAATELLQNKKMRIIPWLFHDPDGNPLAQYFESRDYWKPSTYFRKHWKNALQSAGLSGRRLHDFRRTGIRRFGREGIDDAVGMKLSGHKSLRIYHEYKAVHEADLLEASKKLSRLRNGKFENTGKGRSS